MRRLWILLLAACSEPPPEPRSAAPPPVPARPVVAPPEVFSRDIRASEEAAEALAGDLAGPFCHALKTEDPPALRAVLAPGTRGALWGPAVVEVDDPAVLVERHAPAEGGLEREALAAQLLENRKQFKVLERCSLKPFRFLLSEPKREAAWAKLAFDLAGPGLDGRPRTEHADLEVQLTLTPDGWRIAALVAEPLRVTTVRAPAFAEVAGEVGLGLFREEATRAALTRQTDEQRLETVGGLAVIDPNRDGRPDLLVWNRRRTLQLFTNDGRGGFTRESDLVEPRQVGYHLLQADLDGDGREELVSSELVGCARDRGRFPIFRWEDGKLAPATHLEFDLPCVDPGRAIYQHITTADVDQDGDLDLLVAGFGNHLSRRGAFNHFHSDEGERNLLFLNQGGLRFTEEGQARGLKGTRFSYVAAFFDHDQDGDEDLYVANDFGPNELFLNDGKGFFTAVVDGPLVENGQSMGLTVADFDGDQQLDLYVSNMYSKAGKRIVPLVEGGLAPATYQALLGLAAGNALYTRQADGTYASKAAELGIAKAGWAWGQAYADLDNDGDRDLYVVNGMTSHSQIQEKDF